MTLNLTCEQSVRVMLPTQELELRILWRIWINEVIKHRIAHTWAAFVGIAMVVLIIAALWALGICERRQ